MVYLRACHLDSLSFNLLENISFGHFTLYVIRILFRPSHRKFLTQDRLYLTKVYGASTSSQSCSPLPGQDPLCSFHATQGLCFPDNIPPHSIPSISPVSIYITLDRRAREKCTELLRIVISLPHSIRHFACFNI